MVLTWGWLGGRSQKITTDMQAVNRILVVADLQYRLEATVRVRLGASCGCSYWRAGGGARGQIEVVTLA